jgi:hypothetical protein
MARLPTLERLPVVLSAEEVALLLAHTSSLKDRAALSLAYGWLRVSVVTRLKVSNIDSTCMPIRVEQGKGRKDRYVKPSPALLDLLRQRRKVKQAKGWLFPGREPGQPITTRQMDRACRAAATAAKLDKRVCQRIRPPSRVPAMPLVGCFSYPLVSEQLEVLRKQGAYPVDRLPRHTREIIAAAVRCVGPDEIGYQNSDEIAEGANIFGQRLNLADEIDATLAADVRPVVGWVKRHVGIASHFSHFVFGKCQNPAIEVVACVNDAPGVLTNLGAN